MLFDIDTGDSNGYYIVRTPLIRSKYYRPLFFKYYSDHGLACIYFGYCYSVRPNKYKPWDSSRF